MKIHLLAAFPLLFTSLSAGPRETVTPNDTARLLAGLPVPGTSLESLTAHPAWIEHAQAFDRAWNELEKGQLARIHAWEAENLGDALTSTRPMFYLFSGPDALYAQTFFRNASSYVLAGLEPAGTPPDVTHLPSGAFARGLVQLRNSLDSAFSFSFFKTKNMKEDLSKSEFSGTLPILYIFLARTNATIQSVELLSLDKTGAFASGQATIPGARITFSRTRGRKQTLYYFSTNLADGSIEENPGFIRFCESLGRGNSLVKAASYLMHTGSFNRVRDFLLQQSDTLVQDDSGIPLKYFTPAQWNTRCFGSYLAPIDLFKERYQPDLADEYHRQRPQELPFSFGYRWHPKESGLIIATAKSASNQLFPSSNRKNSPSEKRALEPWRTIKRSREGMTKSR